MSKELLSGKTSQSKIGGDKEKNEPVSNFELTAEQQQELKEAFAIFDEDGDQNIDAKELLIVLEAIGRKVTLPEVSEMIAKFDKDGNEEIEYDEFL